MDTERTSLSDDEILGSTMDDESLGDADGDDTDGDDTDGTDGDSGGDADTDDA